METRKGFVFSLDSFVAFVLTIAALYSLLFFSTVPSAYYAGLMQTNYFAKDTLTTLATTQMPEEEITYLDRILADLRRGDDYSARVYVGATGTNLVPRQFGYRFEVLGDDNETWTALYDTRDDQLSENRKEYHKMKASAQTMYFGYIEERERLDNPYGYLTCSGDRTPCDLPVSGFRIGQPHLELVRFTVYT